MTIQQMKRYLAAGLLICALCGGAGAEENQPSFMSLDDIVENNIKGWGFYDPCTNDDYSKEISLTPQTEKLHGTPKGLLITFKNVIKPTKLGDAENDKFRIVPFSDVKKFSNEIVKYTRLSCWAYVEGERNPLVGIMMYYNDPDTQKVKTLMDFIPAEPGKWTKLILRYDQLPLKVRGNLMKIAVFQYYMRPEIGDDKEGGTRLYLDDFRLEREEERQCYGTDADPRVVIVNKIGYGPNDKKTLVVNQNNPSLNFSVHESDSGKEVFAGPLDLALTHYGPVKTGDFSSLRKEGKYFVKAGNIRSVDFAVDKNIYWDLANIFRRVCYNSRVGCKTDKHDANLLDTAYRVDTGKHVDLSGGYADASDVSAIYNRNTYRMLFASAICANAALNSGVSAADYIDEAGWAFKHIEKLVNEFGFKDIPKNLINDSPSHKFKGGRHNQYYTDNISETEDDHVVYGGKDAPKNPVCRLLDVVRGLAILNRMDKVPDELKNKSLSYAEKLWAEYCPSFPEESKCRLAGCDIYTFAPACDAAIEMYKATGNIAYKDFAVKAANTLLNNQKTALLVNKNLNITGYFHSDNFNFAEFYILWQPVISALSQMCLSFPEHPDAFKWRAALLICRDFYINNLINFQKPYGVAPFEIKDIQDKDMSFDYKNPGNEIFLGYDDEHNRYLFATYARDLGWKNAVYGQMVLSMAMVFNDLALQESSRANLGWPLGENQFNGSDAAEIGQDPLVQYYGNHGRLPGAMVTGNLRHNSYSRTGLITSYKEIFIAITKEMMQLAAMLGEQFTLSGKITGSDGKVVVCNSDDPEGFSQTIKLDKDGAFGPLKLPGNCAYKVTSGKISRMIPAVSGAGQYVAFDSEGDLSVKALGIAQEAEVVNKTTKEKTKEMKSTPVAELIALETGVEATLTFQISRQGNHPGKGNFTLEAVNMDVPEAQLDFDMEGKDSKDIKVKLMPSKPGHAWAICGKISGSDRFFELTGTTKPAVKEKK